MVGAKFSVNGKLIGKGVSANADELPNVRFDIGAHAWSTKRHLTKIVVAELGGEVAVDLVAAENPERGVLLVATKTAAIHILYIGLPKRNAGVPAGIPARLRDAHCRSRHYGGAQHCCQKNFLVPSHCVAPFVFVLMENPARNRGGVRLAELTEKQRDEG